ncbi:MAG: TonB family protein [Allosphingosinicella sp.]|uniref:TonB family protein n=1 Tax=Allosphingosinicella sp. TaxID=2823234 RepID=UPI003950DA8F
MSLAFIAAAALAAQPHPVAENWRLEDRPAECLATHGAGLEIAVTPNSGVAALTVIDPSPALAGAAASGPLQIVLDSPPLRIGDAAFQMFQTGGQKRLSLFRLPSELLQRIATSAELRLEQGGSAVAAFPLGPVGEAIDGIRRCEETRLREWGVDVEALLGLQRRPHPLVAVQIGVDDYPTASRSAREEGMVVVRLDLNAEGRVQECAVAVGSGHAALDRTTCRLYRARARYRPALGADGTPVPSQTVARALWRLP